MVSGQSHLVCCKTTSKQLDSVDLILTRDFDSSKIHAPRDHDKTNVTSVAVVTVSIAENGKQ